MTVEHAIWWTGTLLGALGLLTCWSYFGFVATVGISLLIMGNTLQQNGKRPWD